MSPQALTAGLWVANWEGPYHVDPHDAGLATAWGVSLRYNGAHFTDAQLRALAPQDAAAYLVDNYWPKYADTLPNYFAIPLLAFSVLEGPTQAAYALQRALGVRVDGDLGAQTIAAAASTVTRRDQFLTAFFRACRQRLTESPQWVRDGEGWEARQLAASLAAKVWAT